MPPTTHLYLGALRYPRGLTWRHWAALGPGCPREALLIKRVARPCWPSVWFSGAATVGHSSRFITSLSFPSLIYSYEGMRGSETRREARSLWIDRCPYRPTVRWDVDILICICFFYLSAWGLDVSSFISKNSGCPMYCTRVRSRESEGKHVGQEQSKTKLYKHHLLKRGPTRKQN